MTDGRTGGTRAPAFEASYDPSAEPPSEALIRIVAVATNEQPTRLPPLAETIDPEALDACAKDCRSSVTVRFSYAGYRVVVSTDGTVGLFGE
jgi:hypothetical protein